MFQSIVHFFQEGGPTMYITATAGVIGLAIAYEKGMILFKDLNQDTHAFMARVKELLMQNRMEDAIQLCNAEKKGLLAPVVKAGLERVGCDEALVRQSMESVYLEQVPRATSKINYLNLIANAGMLFGLLGTVMGLIKQFSAVASADASQKQELMARGISEAMNNTALGLMVALPMLVIHGIYAARATKVTEDLERGASQLLDWVGLYNYGQLKQNLYQETSIQKNENSQKQKFAA